jgi:hypothetical protein
VTNPIGTIKDSGEHEEPMSIKARSSLALVSHAGEQDPRSFGLRVPEIGLFGR